MSTSSPSKAAPEIHADYPCELMVKFSAANDNGLRRDVFVQLLKPTEEQAVILADIFGALMDGDLIAANDDELAMGQAKVSCS